MNANFSYRLILLISCALLCSSIATAQVGINTTSPSKQLDINVIGANNDGINISASGFDAQMLTANEGGTAKFILNNSLTAGDIDIRFNSATRFGFSNSALWPAVDAASSFVNGALDLGRFNRHYRRLYTRGIHTNDDAVNGGLSINIGSNGGTVSDYIFSDFAFYPVASQTRDLGRNGNFWRDFYFVSAFTPSDKRLKKNIKSISHGTEMLMKLKLYEYNYTFEDRGRVHYGFMAQELQELLPELVSVGDDQEKSLSINYTETIPIIIKTVQEQQATIEKQNKEIAELREMVEKFIASKE